MRSIKEFLNDETGIGTVEMILILVVLIGLCLMAFIILYENQPVEPVSNVTYVKKVAISFDDGPRRKQTPRRFSPFDRGVNA